MADVHECSKSSQNFSNERNVHRVKLKKLLSSKYIVRKRQPFSLPGKRNKDIFVTNKTNFKMTLNLSMIAQTTRQLIEIIQLYTSVCLENFQ
ncbi:uncharacterized protein LOC143145090 isoform X3 [Ptiloglossa arizonensis]|uniref:uncharacterized protein LOC143145090 isoform X3 n=1 Tax=Ptiloglossa arizonensis TaxID=3350558 RepID=UPI003F9FEDE9